MAEWGGTLANFRFVPIDSLSFPFLPFPFLASKLSTVQKILLVEVEKEVEEEEGRGRDSVYIINACTIQ